MWDPNSPFQQPAGYQDFSRIPIESQLMTMRIIHLALIGGVLMFLGIAVFAGQPGRPNQNQPPIVSLMGLGMAFVMLIARFVAPHLIVKNQLKELVNIDESQKRGLLFSTFQTRLIIGMACLEGACFFNLIGYMSEQQTWTLAVVGVLLTFMLSMFPTKAKVESWAEDIQRNLENQF